MSSPSTEKQQGDEEDSLGEPASEQVVVTHSVVMATDGLKFTPPSLHQFALSQLYFFLIKLGK